MKNDGANANCVTARVLLLFSSDAADGGGNGNVLGDVDDARAAAAALDDPDDPNDARAALGDLGARFAAAALGDADDVVAIAHAGGIAPLVAQVREGASDAQEQAAGALWKLAWRSDDNKVAIARAGGIAPLVALVERGTPEAQWSATRDACAEG